MNLKGLADRESSLLEARIKLKSRQFLSLGIETDSPLAKYRRLLVLSSNLVVRGLGRTSPVARGTWGIGNVPVETTRGTTGGGGGLPTWILSRRKRLKRY